MGSKKNVILPINFERVNVDDKVILEYYKLQKSFEGAIKLEQSTGGVVGIKGGLVGKEKRPFFELPDLRRIGEHILNYCNTEQKEIGGGSME